MERENIQITRGVGNIYVFLLVTFNKKIEFMPWILFILLLLFSGCNKDSYENTNDSVIPASEYNEENFDW